MHTKCPNCNATHKISNRQLKKNNGILRCPKCSTEYDVYETLKRNLHQSPPPLETSFTEPRLKIKKPRRTKQSLNKAVPPQKNAITGEKSPAISQQTSATEFKPQPEPKPATAPVDRLPWEKPSPTKFSFLLDLAIFPAILLLLGQIYYFEGYNLSQNSKFRPWLKAACDLVGCTLPSYKNLNELRILGGSLQTAANGELLFEAAFSNEANFSQEYPMLKLTLFKINGESLAVRIFKPAEYSPKKPYYKTLSPGEIEHIRFSIVLSEENLGGYEFELI